MAQGTPEGNETQAKAGAPIEVSGLQGSLDRTFGLAAAGTGVATELRAGLATFLTMAYIMFVNPAILEKAGMDHGAVFVATCLAAALSTAIMGLYANYPIARLMPRRRRCSSSPAWWRQASVLFTGTSPPNTSRRSPSR
jgi:hypothetical protein